LQPNGVDLTDRYVAGGTEEEELEENQNEDGEVML